MPISDKKFDIVIIIATTGRSDLLKNTLQSIDECEKPDNFKGVFVVENGGIGEAKSIVNSFDKNYYRYIYLKESGKSGALNYAISNFLSEDDLIIFTDDDVIVNDKWIVNYYLRAREYGKHHFYGGSFTVLYEKEPNVNLKHLLPLSARGLDDAEYSKRSVFHGCNWAAFKSAIERAGLFDENIGGGSVTNATGEETIIQRRLLSLGYKNVFIENNQVQHFVPEDKSNISWICHRSVRSGLESAHNNQGNIYGHIYFIFKLSLKSGYYYIRNNKNQLNECLYKLIKVSAKTLYKLNIYRLNNKL